MSNQICFIELEVGNISVIKSLWEKLNQYHREKTKYFGHLYEMNSFEDRIKPILDLAERGSVKIDIAQDTNHNVIVGYCVSTITENGEGEIDSIFLDQNYRGKGIGEALMERALNWFAENNVQDIKIGVVFGNDDVLSFYERFGFYPKSYVLLRKYQ